MTLKLEVAHIHDFVFLQDTYARSIGFFGSTIEPRLKEGRNVLLVAHGNVLRCLISHLAGLSDLEMLRLQVVNFFLSQNILIE